MRITMQAPCVGLDVPFDVQGYGVSTSWNAKNG